MAGMRQLQILSLPSSLEMNKVIILMIFHFTY